MPKYFEYDDPEMEEHVGRIVELAKNIEEKETVALDHQGMPKEYIINNRDKPFNAMTIDDQMHRGSLAMGNGKDHFVVAKHREEQEKFVKKYESMAVDRDAEGNFYVSLAQTAKVAQVVKDAEEKRQNNMGYLQRIKAAIFWSDEVKQKREKAKELKQVVEKVIEAGENLE